MKLKHIFAVILLIQITSCSEEVLFDFEEILAGELVEINEFIARHNYSVEVHESDVRYQISNEGIGRPIELEDTVYFNYQIYLLDSTLMDTNLEEVRAANNLPPIDNMPVRDIIYSFSNGRLGFLNVAFLLGKEESKIHMLVPSHQAFGGGGRVFAGNRFIPPYTPVLVEIEIVDVEPGG